MPDTKQKSTTLSTTQLATPPNDLEAEKAILGSILLNPNILDDIVSILKPEFFYDPRHTAVYEVMTKLVAQQKPIDILFVSDALKGSNAAIDKDFLLELISKSSMASSPAQTCKIIKEKHALRTIIQVGDQLKSSALRDDTQPNDILDSAQKTLFNLSLENIEKNFVPISEVLDETFERIQTLSESDDEHRGIPTGFYDLDKVLGGLHPSDLIILAARPSMGKAQPLTTPIKTKEGWKLLKDLSVGDEIASIDGQSSQVLGIFPQGQKETFEITLADERTTKATSEHLWRVYFRQWESPRVLTTEQIIQKLGKKRYQNRLWIETVSGNFGHDMPLPVDPYLLGCLLGDGGLSDGTPRISSADDELLKEVSKLVDSDLHLVKCGKYDYRISQKNSHVTGVSGVTPNILTEKLKQLGVFEITSDKKYVPEIYKTANRQSRLRILQGLIDTDGWVESFGSVRFASSSYQLALDVQELARSIGAYCKIKSKSTSFTHKGERKTGLPSFVCVISYQFTDELVTLTRKKLKCKQTKRIKRLNILSIKSSQRVETACILVSHPTHLYITENYIVTHNTAFALEISRRVAMQSNKGVAFFSLEMSKDQLVDRILATVSKIDFWKIRTGKFSHDPGNDEFSQLGEALGKLSEAPIWIDDSGSLNILELRSKARRLKYRHDIGLIVIDYLQLMSGRSDTKYSGNRVQEVSDISRGLKLLAKELNVPVLALSQLSRSVEGRDDKRPMLSDLRESGSIEQDADIVIFVHREEMYHKETKKKGIADILISKHRNGEVGSIELSFIHRFATFDNLEGAHLSRRVNQ
jgi:replicative DNA helicase